jgi:hypothetical protein
MTILKRAKVGSLAALFVLSAFAGNAATPTPLVAPDDACGPDGIVVPFKLVAYLIALYEKNIPVEKQLDEKEALDELAQFADPKLDPRKRAQYEKAHPSLLGIEQEVQNMLSRVYDQYRPTNDGQPTYLDYFGIAAPGAKPVTISCRTSDLTPPGRSASVSPTGLRVRGTPGDLIYAAKSDGFAGTSKGTVSFSDNGTNKTRTDQLQTAIGYAFALDPAAGAASRYILVPYVATNRNVSNTSGKPVKFNSETVDFGMATTLLDVPEGGWILSVTPDYLLNLQDDSRLATLHPIVAPHIPNFLNDPWNLSGVFTRCSLCDGSYFMLLADIRSDLGTYTNRGTASARSANKDFARLGSKFGFELFLKNWYDLSVTHTYLHGFAGSRHDLNDFQSSFSFYFGTQNVVGLTVAYKNGLIEQTAQREQSWTAGISAKY